jgi:hypothetical protein
MFVRTIIPVYMIRTALMNSTKVCHFYQLQGQLRSCNELFVKAADEEHSYGHRSGKSSIYRMNSFEN